MIDMIRILTVLFASQCEVSLNAVQHYEDEILRAVERSDHKTVEKSMECLFSLEKKLGGKEAIVSSRFIATLLGRDNPAPEQLNPSYRKLQVWLRKELLSRKGKISHSFLALIAKRKDTLLDPFCAENNWDTCSVFLPTPTQIKEKSPLLGASQILQLQRAKLKFPLKWQMKIDHQLQQLANDPNIDALLKRVLQEVLDSSPTPMSLV